MKTIDEQIKCAESELRMRERVFPQWVNIGRMTSEKADHEVACMKAILGTLKRVKEDKEGGRLL